MRYLCTNCQYIYNEDNGEPEDSIQAGTKFDNLGDNYICPVCGENKDIFQEIHEEINYLGNKPKDNIESEHFINIQEIGKGKIKITVGYEEFHPTLGEHMITSIGIYDEYGDLIYEEFFNKDNQAIIKYDISDLDNYEIRIRCNIHGVWGKKIER